MAQVLLNEPTPNGGDLDANFTELYNKKAWSTTGVGYATGDGAGGSVTQATSKATSVTLAKLTGRIVMNNAALAAGATVNFTLINTTIALNDVVAVCFYDVVSATNYNVWCSAGGGYCRIYLRNISGGSLSEAVELNFVVIKGSAN